MYPVSNAFLNAVKANTRKCYWTGRITTTAGAVYEFDQDDMVKGSGYITSQCCGSTEIELGTVYAAEMGISLFSEINRYTLEGNRRVLVINEEAAVVVRELFDRFLRGEGYVDMIEWFYAEKIHRPDDYRKYGHVHQKEGEELHNWHKAMLNQILNNCAYIGWLICEQKDGERVTGRTSTKVLTGELKVRENNHDM